MPPSSPPYEESRLSRPTRLLYAFSFAIGFFFLALLYFFIKTASTFRFDSQAAFYSPHFYIFALTVLFVFPIIILIRYYRKDRETFILQLAAYVVILGIGFSTSYVFVRNSWIDYCVGQAHYKISLQSFYQKYCKSHPVSEVALLKRAFGNFIGSGGVKREELFEAGGGTPAKSIAPYIAEAQKAELAYLESTPVSVILTCNYIINKDIYNKNISRDESVMGDGLLLVPIDAETQNTDFSGICANLLPDKKIAGVNPSGTGFAGCGYLLDLKVPQQRPLPKELTLLFRPDPWLTSENTKCVRSVEFYASKDTAFQGFHIDGVPEDYIDSLGLKKGFNAFQPTGQ